MIIYATEFQSTPRLCSEIDASATGLKLAEMKSVDLPRIADCYFYSSLYIFKVKNAKKSRRCSFNIYSQVGCYIEESGTSFRYSGLKIQSKTHLGT